ncbi:MAG: type II secretion system F family protein [Pseudomonadota bacterium]
MNASDFFKSFVDELPLFVLVFGSVALLTLIVAQTVFRQRESKKRIEARTKAPKRTRSVDAQVDATLDETHPIGAYYAAIHRWRGQEVKQRLLQAGYYTNKAYARFQMLRLALGLGFFVVFFFGVGLFAPGSTAGQRLAVGVPVFGVGYMAPTFLLDRVLRKQKRTFERLFPDLIDMLVVCVEAGLTIDAAINRVADEMGQSSRIFAIHLQIVMLEVRAGKSMRNALTAFADRTDIKEARTLVSFVRQSEELGVSISRALRVYAVEMRQRRALLAEEKANALPAKMLLPIAVFLFPVTIALVLVPVFVSLLGFFEDGF